MLIVLVVMWVPADVVDVDVVDEGGVLLVDVDVDNIGVNVYGVVDVHGVVEVVDNGVVVADFVRMIL